MSVTLFLCGDVMTGRGIDQVLPHPGDPTLHESSMKDARGYVALAEQAGPLPRGVAFDYVWGDALAILDRVSPDVRIVNLETALTVGDDFQRGKQVHYRTHPANAPCLSAAGIDCCALANNHVMDWGAAGLAETLATLQDLRIATAGAGTDLDEARRPAAFDLPGERRVLVFACGSESSGIPRGWAAAENRPGVNLIDEAAPGSAERIRDDVARCKRPGDVVVASIHWGSNWGHEIPPEQRRFARQLIDDAGVDIVHGHSSHHVRGIEVYRDKPILYGCGDFLTDYEGITGYETYRGDLGLMYFVSMQPETGTLVKLQMQPTQIKRFQVREASPDDARWLAEALNRAGRTLSTRVETAGNGLRLAWNHR